MIRRSTGIFCVGVLATGAVLGTAHLADASPVTMYADAAPASGFQIQSAWWESVKPAVADGTFVNMTNGTFPGTLSVVPQDFMMLSGEGSFASWMFWVEGQSVQSLEGRLEVKMRWDWDGEWRTFAEGGGTIPDDPDLGWLGGGAVNLDDYEGGTAGFFGLSYTANPQNFDLWVQSILENKTMLEGLVRYRDDLESDWQIFSLQLQVIPAPGALSLLAACATLVGVRKRRRDSD